MSLRLSFYIRKRKDGTRYHVTFVLLEVVGSTQKQMTTKSQLRVSNEGPTADVRNEDLPVHTHMEDEHVHTQMEDENVHTQTSPPYYKCSHKTNSLYSSTRTSLSAYQPFHPIYNLRQPQTSRKKRKNSKKSITRSS